MDFLERTKQCLLHYVFGIFPSGKASQENMQQTRTQAAIKFRKALRAPILNSLSELLVAQVDMAG